ncbi:hypothetical protein [Achromobacter mucicolens]|nr:hypothetical protein [Achromobacter mucicolens]
MKILATTLFFSLALASTGKQPDVGGPISKGPKKKPRLSSRLFY